MLSSSDVLILLLNQPNVLLNSIFFFQIKYFPQLEMFGSCSSSSSCSFILGNIERVFDNRWVLPSEVFFIG